jgi:hypothetical protein
MFLLIGTNNYSSQQKIILHETRQCLIFTVISGLFQFICFNFRIIELPDHLFLIEFPQNLTEMFVQRRCGFRSQ